MKGDKNMKGIIGIIVSTLLAMTLVFSTGCGVGGTNIRLQGVSLGTVTMDGRPIQGLPSEKIDLLLNVSAQEISVASTADGAVITLTPSGAVIEINSSGVSIRGLEPEQIKVEWAVNSQD